MNLSEWKARIYDSLWRLRIRKEELAAKTVSGLLSALAIWPVIAAAQKGDMAAMMEFARLSGDLGSNLLFEKFNSWKTSMTSEKEAVTIIEKEIETSPELQAELDRLLEKLEVLTEALSRQEGERSWMEHVLKEEWTPRIGVERVDTVIQMAAEKNEGTMIGVQHNYYGTDGPDAVANQLKAARQTYLEGLSQVCLRLPLASLGLVTHPDKKVTLKQVYIDLDTTTTRNQLSDKVKNKLPKVKGDVDVDDEDNLPLKMSEAVALHQHIVLLGDPGAGKSTFLKYYLSEHCLKNGEEDPLPVYITLRTLADRLREQELAKTYSARQRQLMDWLIEAALAEHERYVDEAFVEAFTSSIQSGRCIMAFDGLDEVPVDERPLIRNVIVAWHELAASPYQSLVTCRVRSYAGDAVLTGTPSFTLANLKLEHMHTFAEAWYNALAESGAYSADRSSERSQDLIHALKSSTIGDVGRNPMLLTTLAIVHEQDNRLPHERVRLYERAIEILLTRWEGEQARLESLAGDELTAFLQDKSRIKPVLRQLAYQAHDAGLSEEGASKVADIEWTDAMKVLKGALGNDLNLARDFLTYIDKRAGLLIGQGDASDVTARFRFVHRTFQEYLAGCYHLRLRDPELVSTLQQLADKGEYWTQAVQLAAEELYHIREDENRLLDVASMLCPESVHTTAEARQVLWSGLCAEIVGPDGIVANTGVYGKNGRGGERFIQRLQQQLVTCLGSSLSPSERAECGRLLGVLGDPRKELTTIEHMAFCFVPAGPFQMGSHEDDELSYDDEKPMQKVDIPYPYWIGRFPVTQAQFSEFTEAGGYDTKKHWTVEGWKKKGEDRWDKSREFHEQYMLGNHPVVGVSWYEAYAYTQWLTEVLQEKNMLPSGWEVALPNEREWEKAARGGLEIPQEFCIRSLEEALMGKSSLSFKENSLPWQRFPYGWDPDPEKMNYGPASIGRTSSPGCFAGGESPYGAQDMAGNVWEWCREKWGGFAAKDDELKDRSDPGGSSSRVLRGGSFGDVDYYCRCAIRDSYYPSFRNDYRGFRLVVRPLSSESL